MAKQALFYILDENADRIQFACQQVEIMYQQKHRIFIQCEDQSQAHQLDNELWLFKRSSFVPHNIQGEGPTPPPPVQIGYSEQATGFNDILVNFSLEVPGFYHQFRQVIEIVDDSDATKQALRKHYRFYQSQGFEVKHARLGEHISP